MPFFSIIIPVYNVAPYLRECLDSVLAQTFAGWEAICVDDGSTDGSGAILDEYAAKDSRFRVVHQPNAGVSTTRNRALKEVRGEWVLFMDPDDFYPSNDVLFKLFEIGSRYDTCLVKGTIRNVDVKGRLIEDWWGKRYGQILRQDFDSCYGFQAYAFKTKMLKHGQIEFPMLTYYEDPPFLAKALSAVDSYVAIKDVVYGYRSRREYEPVNWIGNGGRKIRDKLVGLNLVADVSEQYDLRHIYVNNALHLFDSGTFYAQDSYKLALEELRTFTRRIGNCQWLKQEDIYAVFRAFLGSRQNFICNLFLLPRIIGARLFMRFLLAGVLHYFIAAPVRRVKKLIRRSHAQV